MIAFIETLEDDTCTPKPAKLNAWVYMEYIWNIWTYPVEICYSLLLKMWIYPLENGDFS